MRDCTGTRPGPRLRTARQLVLSWSRDRGRDQDAVFHPSTRRSAPIALPPFRTPSPTALQHDGEINQKMRGCRRNAEARGSSAARSFGRAHAETTRPPSEQSDFASRRDCAENPTSSALEDAAVFAARRGGGRRSSSWPSTPAKDVE